MTCTHGRDEHDPVEPFADDAEYRAYMGLPNTPEGDRIFAALPPEERGTMAEIRMFERMLQRGEIPKGAIACTRVGRTLR